MKSMSDSSSEITTMMEQDSVTAEQLLPLVYDELRRLASVKLGQEKSGQTLQPTALVHEAYLRLLGGDKGQSVKWDSAGHFFAAAAQAMQRILVESARRKKRLKHGGEMDRVAVEWSELPTRMTPDELIALDEALAEFRRQDPLKAQLITLRYFGGLTIEQAADALEISRVSAFRYWTYARAWLHHALTGENRQP